VSEERPHLDPRIAEYYQQSPEEHRLEQDVFVLEGLRTRELIKRYAPHPPATVADIGGGAGAYALWLTDAGYTVHLLDGSPRLVEEARRRSAAHAKPLTSCEVGDARALPFADATADVVLLLGPLYHLTSADDRVRALAEARRVLKPGGILFGAAIARWASALDGLARDLFKDAAFAAIVEQDLRDGQHRNETDRLDYFTTAYFHRPEELRSESIAGGLEVEDIFGIEGPGWLLNDVTQRLADGRQRADLLRVARHLEAEPSTLGLSPHWLLVARKPSA